MQHHRRVALGEQVTGAREPVVFLRVNEAVRRRLLDLPAQDHQIDGVQRQLDHALIPNCIQCLLLRMSDAVVVPLVLSTTVLALADFLTGIVAAFCDLRVLAVRSHAQRHHKVKLAVITADLVAADNDALMSHLLGPAGMQVGLGGVMRLIRLIGANRSNFHHGRVPRTCLGCL